MPTQETPHEPLRSGFLKPSSPTAQNDAAYSIFKLNLEKNKTFLI
jgi:hypothetical protein